MPKTHYEIPQTSNVFITLAATLWSRGEDGKVIAREVAAALDWCVAEGQGTRGAASDKEIQRLLAEARRSA